MATDKQFNIHIGGLKESIDGVTTLEKVLSSLENVSKQANDSTKSVNSLSDAVKKLKEYNGDYQKALAATKAEIAEKNKAVKQEVEYERALETVQKGATNTYYEKQKVLTALGKVIRSMNTETEEEKKQQAELIDRYGKLNQELKDFDAAMGNHQRNVGDYARATTNLKQQLTELEHEMASMLDNGIKKTDPAFVELAKKAGQMKDAIADAKEETKRYASDTRVLDNVINLATSATAAFELYKGAMSAFGVETKKSEEAMQQLMGAMSIIQSLKTLSETLQNGSATAKLFNIALKATGAELVANQVASVKAAVANTTLSGAQKATTVTTKLLSLALKSIPLMLVIGLVAMLITNWKDVVGWFEKTFPVLKKMNGLMGGLRTVIVGLGKAILNWLVNPIKTLGAVLEKIFAGDFSGALKAASEGLKNQFKGTVDAFKEGVTEQIGREQEKITQKQVEEENKRTKHNLDMLKAQKGNEAKYSKEGIALQKKDFEERKKLAKGNQEELDKIAVEEANFYRECQESKQKAAEKASKAAAKAAKEAAEEAKKAEEQRKSTIDSRTTLLNAETKANLALNKAQEKAAKLEVEKYQTGPVKKYMEAVKKLQKIQENALDLENKASIVGMMNEMEKEFPNIIQSTKDGAQKLESLMQEFVQDRKKFNKKLLEDFKLTEEQANKFMTKMTEMLTVSITSANTVTEQALEIKKQIVTTQHNELSVLSRDAQDIYKDLLDKLKGFNTDPIRDKWLGIIDVEKTKKKLENIQKHWQEAADQINPIIIEQQGKWDNYIDNMEKLYGKDSQAYKDAVREKIKALEALYEIQEQVYGRLGEVNLGGDYNADGKSDTPEPKKKMWDKSKPFLDNLAMVFKNIDEMVLGPAMDTFAMYMDFAIEETQQKLAIVEEMHDKALDKVDDSTERIEELQNRLKEANETDMGALKEQMADEQLLYAQRLAEEQRLAEQERALKNKAARQEADARKMELRYQMFQSIGNTAQGASKALADWGWPLGAVFAGLMTALGAVQTALIARQIGQIKPVKYAQGGLLSGPSHSNGGIPVGNTGVEVEGGEMVVNKKDTARYMDVLTKINKNDPSVRWLQGNSRSNADTQIRRFANGGSLPNFERMDGALQQTATVNRLVEAIDRIEFEPVVSVVDINKVNQRLTRVRSLAGKK